MAGTMSSSMDPTSSAPVYSTRDKPFLEPNHANSPRSYSVALQKNSDGGTAIPWTKVRKTRKSRPINRTDVKNATQQLRTVTGKSARDSELVGSMPAKHIYVSKLNTDITPDHISDYMRKKNIHVRQTRKVSKDEWLHGSFKVAINAEDLERVLDEEFWPERVCCREWLPFIAKNRAMVTQLRRTPHH
ncbi:hypothetical protein CAPTEDRAFT_208027 [Capitella teleta]|uniref:Uncharacterized protein n=1 Tax=Capitella teleta TaxID=283909 RepID=R7VDM7_CAPTE|nr:hypothetical protein CAPTEDRAFT_208027 [Capitella teleta]|eukprot:ELU16953.1 hypothetical protein CAPTEDRAFT_208027 [Capitella teleta]